MVGDDHRAKSSCAGESNCANRLRAGGFATSADPAVPSSKKAASMDSCAASSSDTPLQSARVGFLEDADAVPIASLDFLALPFTDEVDCFRCTCSPPATCTVVDDDDDETDDDTRGRLDFPAAGRTPLAPLEDRTVAGLRNACSTPSARLRAAAAAARSLRCSRTPRDLPGWETLAPCTDREPALRAEPTDPTERVPGERVRPDSGRRAEGSRSSDCRVEEDGGLAVGDKAVWIAASRRRCWCCWCCCWGLGTCVAPVVEGRESADREEPREEGLPGLPSTDRVVRDRRSPACSGGGGMRLGVVDERLFEAGRAWGCGDGRTRASRIGRRDAVEGAGTERVDWEDEDVRRRKERDEDGRLCRISPSAFGCPIV